MNITQRTALVLSAGLLATGGAVGTTSAAPVTAAPAKYFSSCDKLMKKYPNGVARNAKAAKRAVRQGFYRPATSRKATRDYRVNASRLDRDRDGVACEQM